MTGKAAAAPRLSVPRWTDWLSGLQARWPGPWISLGNLESRALAEQLAARKIVKPIWVSGLARAGTTILLEILARHPQLATHRYRDFPPVLTPWSWNWFVERAGMREQAAAERAHADGILVTPDSPEAFEEVVWMAFFRDAHDPESSAELSADTANRAFEDFYRAHIRKILLIRGGQRYLAKANYNVTRLAYLLGLFPDARFIIPFRDPARHIASLMRQHRRFVAEHERDDRLRRHMSRGGHFEFGLDRRPINHGDSRTTQRVLDLWEGGREVEGWSLYWNDLHAYLAETVESSEGLRRATMLVDYDRFCASPREVMQEVTAHADLASGECDLAGEAARTIRPPSDRVPFSDEERAAIAAATSATWNRLREMSGTVPAKAAVI